jgi:hypothetical protein
VDEVKRTDIRDGILGRVRFDANGDVDPASFGLYRYRGGDPELVGVVSVPGALNR